MEKSGTARVHGSEHLLSPEQSEGTSQLGGKCEAFCAVRYVVDGGRRDPIESDQVSGKREAL